MENQKVILADVVRTPWGKPNGSMEKFLSSDLAAAAIKKLLERTGVEPAAVDQVVFGQAHPSTLPNNIGHFAWLKAELPVEVPGYTVQSLSGSALQAVRNAYYLIATGNEGIVMAGGADSYSAAPFVLRNVRNHFFEKDRVIRDSIVEAECCTQPEPMSRMEQYELAHGKTLSAEAVAFAADSRKKAAAFAELCGDAISPVSYTDRKKGVITIDKDEYLAGDAAEGALSPYADGAAVTLLMNEAEAKKWNVTPKAEVLGFAVAGVDPKQQQTAGAAAVKKLLARKGVSMDDVACLEVVENSAEDVLETVRALGGHPVVNPLGGAMAYGKNDGAEGIAMLQRLLASLKPQQLGVVCLYTAGGQGIAALVRKL